eukprot:2917738-Ditylum_brightwellii.AAC.1
MMLEVGQKIISNLLCMRLDPLVCNLDHKSHCDFRSERGTGVATFALKTALKKQKEHNLETWILFINFVKAFECVPRDLLWNILEKIGLPPKLVRLIIAILFHGAESWSLTEADLQLLQ